MILDGPQLAELELIATGATPFAGFLGEADHESVVAHGKLADGTPWPVPFALAGVEGAIGRTLELRDEDDRVRGSLRVTEIYDRDGRRFVAGPVALAQAPLPFASHRLSPHALRERIAARGWKKVAAFDVTGPLTRADEHLARLLLEQVDGLVLHPLVGETRGTELPADVRFAQHAALAAHLPADRVLLAAFPAAPRSAGPRDIQLLELLRARYGITSGIVSRELAGAGAFYCRACEGPATARTCGHAAEQRVVLTGARVRQLVRTGAPLPRELVRPEIAEILRAHHLADVHAAVAAPVVSLARGFILWFTGMSGAGKSTLATALARRLAGARPLEILDGDEVRTHLSRGLGFSREDRDVNVHRIAFVARTLARHGVGVVTAAISPYAETRAAVRALAEAQGIPFVEVFAKADLAALVDRDPKGLYKKALAGEIEHFTGVTDPYEAPEAPDVTVRTDVETIEVSVSKIVAALAARGLVALDRAQGVA